MNKGKKRAAPVNTGESSAARWIVPKAAAGRSDGARTARVGAIPSGIIFPVRGVFRVAPGGLDRGSAEFWRHDKGRAYAG